MQQLTSSIMSYLGNFRHRIVQYGTTGTLVHTLVSPCCQCKHWRIQTKCLDTPCVFRVRHSCVHLTILNAFYNSMLITGTPTAKKRSLTIFVLTTCSSNLYPWWNPCSSSGCIASKHSHRTTKSYEQKFGMANEGWQLAWNHLVILPSEHLLTSKPRGMPSLCPACGTPFSQNIVISIKPSRRENHQEDIATSRLPNQSHHHFCSVV